MIKALRTPLNSVPGRSSSALPPFYSFIVLLVISLAAVLIVIPFEFSPVAVISRDSPLNEFSEERARVSLKYLTEDIGIRPAFSKNFAFSKKNNDTVNYLSKLLHGLQDQYPERIYVEMENYEYGGSFSQMGVVVRGSNNNTSASAAMVSAHFDSVPTGPGATDDAVGIAIMIETITVLANSAVLPYDIIFMFINGEEKGCLGSSFFRESSNLRDRPSVVINFEGSGMADREVLIRSNSAWMSKWYADTVGRPIAYSLTEMIFATLAVGCTDIDVYNRMGIHAMDLVYVNNRYAYHTLEDNYANVRDGALQHGGENLLNLLLSLQHRALPDRLTDGPGVGLPNTRCCRGFDAPLESNTVYYSVFTSTLWMDKTVARVVFSVVSVVYFLLVFGAVRRWVPTQDIEPVNGKMLCSLIGVHVLTLLVGLLLSVLGFLMAVVWRDVEVWYGSANNFRVSLYCASMCVSLVLFSRYLSSFKYANISTGALEFHGLLSVFVIYNSLLLIFGLAIPDLAFIPLWQVFFLTVSLFLYLGIHTRCTEKSRKFQFIMDGVLMFIALFIPLLFALELVNFLDGAFGYFLDGMAYDTGSMMLESVYAILVALMTFICALGFSPYFFRFRGVKTVVVVVPVLIFFCGSLIGCWAMSASDSSVPPI